MKRCEHCDQEYIPRRPGARYCCTLCATKDAATTHEQTTLVDVEPTPKVTEPAYWKHA